jgi:Rrf2 family iron-sulfur cluster assembly transcriptional regulator
MLSPACEYAIQTAVYLAKKPDGEYTLVREISRDLGVSPYFLSKITRNLVKERVLISRTGPKGGLALSKKPSEIVLMDVVNVIDGTDFTTWCIMGLDRCDETLDCPLHDIWCAKRDQIQAVFSTQSIAQLGEALQKKTSLL